MKEARVPRQATVGTSQAEREVLHGEWLAGLNTEEVWGWGTPAGRLRASRRAALIAEGAELREGRRALEIGCGSGMFTEMFAATGATIMAVDISRELLEKATARQLPPERVTFVHGRFEDCEVDGPFDAVIGSSVLHHLEVAAAIRQVFRLLRPGGLLSFAEPNLLNPQVFIERKLRFLPVFKYISPDETAFVRWRFARQLVETGFEEVSIVPFDWLHPATPQTLINCVRAVSSVIEKTLVMREFSGSLYIKARRGC
jgi:2-polyprenyl-3-methyl-5-hydroxy-6-metoxy-1,4-benzoquinol methylase